MSPIRLFLVAVLFLAATSVEAAPFFDAIYDAINGNPRRSYGYTGYGNYGYGSGYSGYNYGYQYPNNRNAERAPRQGKTYKEICRVHFPDAAAVPGTGGIVCPY